MLNGASIMSGREVTALSINSAGWRLDVRYIDMTMVAAPNALVQWDHRVEYTAFGFALTPPYKSDKLSAFATVEQKCFPDTSGKCMFDANKLANLLF